MDAEYLRIVIGDIKSDLAAIEIFNSRDNDIKCIEYLEDVIKRVINLKKKLC